jgi:membrane-associated phospholipid phosphatase
LLTPAFLRSVGFVAAVALVCELLLMPRLVEIDAALWRVVLYTRGCTTDTLIDRIVEVTTWVAIAVLIAAALLRLRSGGVGAVWPPVAVCLLGLHLGKVLKNVFVRERPSMLPGSILGHSFPSGHVMNTTLAALAIIVLAAGFRHPRRWACAALTIVTVIVFGRLMLAHHWLLDAVGGLLAAIALNGLALPLVRRRPLLAPSMLAVALTIVLAIVTRERTLGIRLPSPLSIHETDGVELQIADVLGSDALNGGWITPAEHFRRGMYAWLKGSGMATIDMGALDARHDRTNVRPIPAGWQASLAIGGRPDISERRCLTMQVRVNGRDLPPFVPFVGWREYRLLLPAGTLHPGANDVRIGVTDAAGEPWRFAVAYLRVDLD